VRDEGPRSKSRRSVLFRAADETGQRAKVDSLASGVYKEELVPRGSSPAETHACRTPPAGYMDPRTLRAFADQ